MYGDNAMQFLTWTLFPKVTGKTSKPADKSSFTRSKVWVFKVKPGKTVKGIESLPVASIEDFTATRLDANLGKASRNELIRHNELVIDQVTLTTSDMSRQNELCVNM